MTYWKTSGGAYIAEGGARSVVITAAQDKILLGPPMYTIEAQNMGLPIEAVDKNEYLQALRSAYSFITSNLLDGPWPEVQK